MKWLLLLLLLVDKLGVSINLRVEGGARAAVPSSWWRHWWCCIVTVVCDKTCELWLLQYSEWWLYLMAWLSQWWSCLIFVGLFLVFKKSVLKFWVFNYRTSCVVWFLWSAYCKTRVRISHRCMSEWYLAGGHVPVYHCSLLCHWKWPKYIISGEK